MLGPDLVRVRRRGDALQLSQLKNPDREVARQLAADLLDVVGASKGDSLEDVGETVGSIDRAAKHEKLFCGLKKLLLDQCAFGSPVDIDAVSLRRDIFSRASRARQALSGDDRFARERILQEVAETHGVEVESIEHALFSDLKGAALLTEVPSLRPETLVEQYEIAQVQGILLRAVQLQVRVECGSQDAARRLFQKLKFRQLLYRMHQAGPDVYVIEIEGPFSLFESVTKYGLQLALLVPALLECKSAELEAKVRWGKDRRDLVFRTTLACRGSGEGEASGVRSDVETLLSQLRKKKSDFSIALAREILDVPGEGLCVPDLKFEAPGRPPIYLEVMGFWSRDAVFRRVKWAESQSDKRVLFAVSSRLRVKKEVLDAESGSALYVYKGTMNAASVLAQVTELSSSA